MSRARLHVLERAGHCPWPASLLGGLAHNSDIGCGAPGFAIDLGEDANLDVASPDGLPAAGRLHLPVFGKGDLGGRRAEVSGGVTHVELRFGKGSIPASILAGEITKAGDAVGCAEIDDQFPFQEQ